MSCGQNIADCINIGPCSKGHGYIFSKSIIFGVVNITIMSPFRCMEDISSLHRSVEKEITGAAETLTRVFSSFVPHANYNQDPTESAKIVRVYFGQEPHARGNSFIYFLQRTITARLHGLVVKWEEKEQS